MMIDILQDAEKKGLGLTFDDVLFNYIINKWI